MEDVIGVPGEPTMKKSMLVELFQKHIFKPFKETFMKSETDNRTHYADVIVRNEKGEVLLLQRKYSGEFEAGKWGFPGGHVDAGEDFVTAAARELKEETGLDCLPGLIEVKQVGDAVIHYYQAFAQIPSNGQGIDNSICLNIDEHRGWEWVAPSDFDNYDMILDLGSYAEDLTKKCVQIAVPTGRKYSNPEEEIAMVPGGTGSLEETWKVITLAFDDGQITEEQFFKARAQYQELKKSQAIELIKKAFDEGSIDVDRYMDAISKGIIK